MWLVKQDGEIEENRIMHPGGITNGFLEVSKVFDNNPNESFMGFKEDRWKNKNF